MKKILFAGLAIAVMMSGGSVFAQNNGYNDDVYYDASQAKKDALANVDSSNQYAGQQQNSGQPEQYDDNAYVDYSDNNDYDYAQRIRQFYYPISGIGFYSNFYSPYWSSPYYGYGYGYTPYYSNYSPIYGWGNSWYSPMIGFEFGYSNPYWSFGWGWHNWWGWSPWYYSYGGYWNGYYAGINDGWYNNWYGGNNYRHYTYGPRGSRRYHNEWNYGNYGIHRRTITSHRFNTVRPERVSSTGVYSGSVSHIINNNGRRRRTISLGNTHVYNNNYSSRGARERMMNTGGRYRNHSTMRTYRYSGNTNRSSYREYRSPSHARSFQHHSRSFSHPSYSRSSSHFSRSYSRPSHSFSSSSSRRFSGGSRSGGGHVRSFRR